MNTKVEKDTVAYTPHADVHSERCELCRHFMPLYRTCRKVKGKIVASGWCELFSRKET